MDEKTQAAPTIRERVAAGAAWLDRARPGWPLRIDLITLNVSQPECCVLGQVFDDFERRPRPLVDLGVAEAHGFYVDPYRSRQARLHTDVLTEYQALTNEWRALIEGRILPAAKACCPCQRAVCEPGCTCTSPDCPKSEAEVLDD